MNGFHEILFPLDIALGARGGPERRTDVVTLGSNRETRNARWARSRRKWDAGYGVKTFADLATIVAFFEERRGRLYGFRWRDRARLSVRVARRSAGARATRRSARATATRTCSSSAKTYGRAFAPYGRDIVKPVEAAVRVAVGGQELARERISPSIRRRASSRSPPRRRRRRRRDRRLSVRHAGALRHRLSRNRSERFRGRRNSENPDHRNPAVRLHMRAFPTDFAARSTRRDDALPLLAPDAAATGSARLHRSRSRSRLRRARHSRSDRARRRAAEIALRASRSAAAKCRARSSTTALTKAISRPGATMMRGRNLARRLDQRRRRAC